MLNNFNTTSRLYLDQNMEPQAVSGVATRRSKRLSDEGLQSGMKRVALGDVTNKVSEHQLRRSGRLQKNSSTTTAQNPTVEPHAKPPQPASEASQGASSTSSSRTTPNTLPVPPTLVSTSSISASLNTSTSSSSTSSFRFNIQPAPTQITPSPAVTQASNTAYQTRSATLTQSHTAIQPSISQDDPYWSKLEYTDIDRSDLSDPEGEPPKYPDPQICSEYAEEIFQYLRGVENRLQPTRGSDYMKQQTDITPHMRMILVDWLVEVTDEYKLSTETLYLAVNYVDRFLSRRSIARGGLQLLGVACMLIASKYEEIYPPSVEDFVYISDNTYRREQVFTMEGQVLDVLEFSLTVATPKVFLRRFQRAAGADATVIYLSSYLCELALLDYTMNQYLPSTVATASVCLALHTIRRPSWSPTLEFYTRHRLSDSHLQSCIRDLLVLHRQPIKEHAQAIYDKYSAESFMKIAETIKPATTLPF
eukprot:TRINITY_DN784_c0_g1_i1.p1 TRINITY_DN784_c0_g1~~TRINITY_DN784_c0_g1_i1.p1  ORF type:complete len:477 (-),score=76.68 TRINITY_DN784_c0_g1_i1:346-1776(-)